jgi:short-chain fatty acids transporter
MSKGVNHISRALLRLVDHYLPEPFTFVIVLTLVTLVFALLATDAGAAQTLGAWGEGLSQLLAFTSQICLTLLFAYALAHTRAMKVFLETIARAPRSPRQAYVLVTLIAGALSLLSWPLGLIGGGIIAREVGRHAAAHGLRLHYPLLGASAFGGFVVWHMGYSASAPLFVATAGNAMEQQIGGLIPVTETIFANWNMLTAAATLLTVAAVAAAMHPADADIEEFSDTHARACGETNHDSGSAERAPGPADFLERSAWLSRLIGALLLAYLVYWFATRGLALNLNVVNWSFLALGLLLAGSTRAYATLVMDGARTVVPTLLQYPLYGGVMGIMVGTGAATAMAGWFSAIATPGTLALWAFLSGGLLNIFIPSGGAQWTVQGPVFIEAARAMDVDIPLVVMGVAYGDQWTNLIHPFTVITLLVVTGLGARQVLAYSALLCLAAGVPLGGGLLLASHFS